MSHDAKEALLHDTFIGLLRTNPPGADPGDSLSRYLAEQQELSA